MIEVKEKNYTRKKCLELDANILSKTKRRFKYQVTSENLFHIHNSLKAIKPKDHSTKKLQDNVWGFQNHYNNFDFFKN